MILKIKMAQKWRRPKKWRCPWKWKCLKNKYDPKNEDHHKSYGNPKNEDDPNNEDKCFVMKTNVLEKQLKSRHHGQSLQQFKFWQFYGATEQQRAAWVRWDAPGMTSQVAWRIEWVEKGGCWLANNQHSLNLIFQLWYVSQYCFDCHTNNTIEKIWNRRNLVWYTSFLISTATLAVYSLWFLGNKVFSERCHHQEHPRYPRGTIVFLFMFPLSTPVTIIVTINC